MSVRKPRLNKFDDGICEESQLGGTHKEGKFGLAYPFAIIVAVIMTVSSLVGILYRTVLYPTQDLLLSFVPGDICNIVLGLPVLIVSLSLFKRERLVGLFLLSGALFYVVYMYIPYTVVFLGSAMSLVYLALVVLSLYAIIMIVRGINGERVRLILNGKAPVRISAGILIALAMLIIGRQAAQIAGVLSGHAQTDIVEIATWISDFTVAVPALLVAGIQLWRRKPFGFTTGAGLLLGYGMLSLGLIPFFLMQSHFNGAPIDMGGMMVVGIMALLCFIPLAFYLRAAVQSSNTKRAGREKLVLEHLSRLAEEEE